MMARNISHWSESWTAILSDRTHENLHAQAHARQILNDLDTPVDDWPRFRRDLDDRLLHTAHLMLVAGLDFLDAGESDRLANSLLERGAESLEYAVATRPSRMSVPDESLKAAVAYHIAGHHARSYVLSEPLVAQEWTDTLPRGLLALLRRDFSTLAGGLPSSHRIEGLDTSDIDSALIRGDTTEDAALTAIGHGALLYALNLYVEFVKRGSNDLLDQALLLCATVAELGRESRHVDLWWWGRATKHLLGELGDSSLWRCIGNIGPETPYGRPIDRYIEGALGDTPSMISLWPSQRKAIALIAAPDSPSFCVRMPTSAGKTKIAELAIIRALLDADLDREAKCLYIAPFRSLAVEVETSLSQGLKPLGVRVSEIYGGFDLTAHDERLIAETQVLVATPEKLDAVLRLVPEIFDDVRLVAIDEGHIAGDLSERGIRAEVLFTRLLRRLGRERCRHVFVSAVLPNPTEFARWIAGDGENLVESDWRPARLALGELEWNGSRVRVDINHDVSGSLDEAVFVSRFIERREVRGLPGVGQRRNPFPNDAREAFAASAIRFSFLGTTLAFVPQSRHVESTARAIRSSLKYFRSLAQQDERPFEFPVPEPDSDRFLACLTAIRLEFGSGSPIEQLLREGIAIHHGSLPGRVRVAIERLIRSGEVKLIVATTTLGQGVNLPIRTVLIRGLQQGQDTKVDPKTLWNIAGRAGRAMRENEGYVLFFNDTTRRPGVVQRQRQYVNRVIERTAIADVIGMLYRILKRTRNLWRRHAGTIEFEELCRRLAEDDFDWLPEDDRPNLRAIYELVDQHMLALAVESGLGPGTLESLQQLLQDSLLFAQLDAHPIEGLDEQSAAVLIDSRIKSVFRRIPRSSDRTRFYRMGLSLADCELVVSLDSELRDLVMKMRDWSELGDAARLDILMEFAELALQISAAYASTNVLPTNVVDIVRAWLQGKRGIDLVNDGLASELDDDPGRSGRFLEDLCVYGLAWVLTAFVSYVRETVEDTHEPLPPAFELVPAMFKNGVSDPLAAVFSPYLEGARDVATRASQACPHDVESLGLCITWLQSSTSDVLEAAGLSAEDVAIIMDCQRHPPSIEALLQRDDSFELTVSVDTPAVAGIASETPLLLQPQLPGESGEFDLLNLRGERLGTWVLEDVLPLWMAKPYCVTTTVTAIRSHEDVTELDLAVVRIA